MNDKRAEIELQIAKGTCLRCDKYRFNIAGCKDEQYWGTPCARAFETAGEIIRRINPLVVIPVEGELPELPSELAGDCTKADKSIYKHYYAGWNNGQQKMKQAGYVLGKKLVEATNET